MSVGNGHNFTCSGNTGYLYSSTIFTDEGSKILQKGVERGKGGSGEGEVGREEVVKRTTRTLPPCMQY